MRSSLTLLADRELPEHLLADTEQALIHVGWLGVRRRSGVGHGLYTLRFEGVAPPVALAHAGHDHAALLADLCAGWTALDVVCALRSHPAGEDIGADTTDVFAAAEVLEHLAGDPTAPGDPAAHEGFRVRLEALFRRACALGDDELAVAAAAPATPAAARALLETNGNPRRAVALAGARLGLDAPV